MVSSRRGSRLELVLRTRKVCQWSRSSKPSRVMVMEKKVISSSAQIYWPLSVLQRNGQDYGDKVCFVGSVTRYASRTQGSPDFMLRCSRRALKRRLARSWVREKLRYLLRSPKLVYNYKLTTTSFPKQTDCYTYVVVPKSGLSCCHRNRLRKRRHQ